MGALAVRLAAGGGHFVAILRDEASYGGLIACYKQRTNGILSGSWKQGWTKTGRCEMVAKEAFEQLKRIDATTANGDLIRRQIAKVLEDDVIPVLGETNRLAHMVDTRIDNAGIFHKVLQHSTTLHLKKGLQDLGPQTPNVQWVNKNGVNIGAPRPGYASILDMSSSEVDDHLAKLADFEREIENVDPKILKAMTFDKDDFYNNVNLAKAQLKMRKDRLKTLASEMATSLLDFRRRARALDRVDDTANHAGAGQAALTLDVNRIKANLDAVEDQYQKLNSEERNWVKGQLDQLNASGRCPRSKKALAANLQEPMIAVSDAIYALIGTGVIGVGLNGAALMGGTLGTVGAVVTAILSPTSVIAGAGVLAYMNYRRGGAVAELFE